MLTTLIKVIFKTLECFFLKLDLYFICIKSIFILHFHPSYFSYLLASNKYERLCSLKYLVHMLSINKAIFEYNLTA